MAKYGLFFLFCLFLQDQRLLLPAPRHDLDGEKRANVAPTFTLGTDGVLPAKIAGSVAFQGFLPGPLAGHSWGHWVDIGQSGLFPLDFLLHTRPLDFLDLCVTKYDQEVKSYSLTFRKYEKGKTRGMEKLKVHFREQPFSVFMQWLENPGLTSKVLFVKGENDDKLLAPVPIFGIKKFAPNDTLAKNSSRYTIDQFGLKLATLRSIGSMRKAQAEGKLFLEYRGLVQVPELGNRLSHKFVRTPYDPPEEEGVNELTLYIDQETLLQTGSILKDAAGQVVAEYYFTDIELNPEFGPDQFREKALR